MIELQSEEEDELSDFEFDLRIYGSHNITIADVLEKIKVENEEDMGYYFEYVGDLENIVEIDWEFDYATLIPINHHLRLNEYGDTYLFSPEIASAYVPTTFFILGIIYFPVIL